MPQTCARRRGIARLRAVGASASFSSWLARALRWSCSALLLKSGHQIAPGTLPGTGTQCSHSCEEMDNSSLQSRCAWAAWHMCYLQQLMADMGLVRPKPDTSCPSCCAEGFMKTLQSHSLQMGLMPSTVLQEIQPGEAMQREGG